MVERERERKRERERERRRRSYDAEEFSVFSVFISTKLMNNLNIFIFSFLLHFDRTFSL